MGHLRRLLKITLMSRSLGVENDMIDPYVYCQGFEVVNSRFMNSYDDEDTPPGSGFRTKLRELHKR